MPSDPTPPPATIPHGRWIVVDRHGARYALPSRREAYGYARLWDRDCPDDAPHRVEDADVE